MADQKSTDIEIEIEIEIELNFTEQHMYILLITRGASPALKDYTNQFEAVSSKPY